MFPGVAAMDAPASSDRRIRAGLFEVDLNSLELIKSGRQVHLQEQPFRVLAVLLERPGEVITREELQARLWRADTFVGFDEGINTAIRKLRVAFGDSADNPRFIETVPRRGYRFVAPVVLVPTVSSVQGTTSPTTPTQSDHPDVSLVIETPKQHKWGLTAGFVGLVMLAAVGYIAYFKYVGKAATRFQNYTISQITDNAKSQAAAISPDGKTPALPGA
jgi:DNA-binding winged helix-turn-helix (wHTH) protein